jgi:hypothetical protein
MTFPIILAHGVCRFDVVTNEILKLDNNDDPKLDRLHYFRGVRTMLKAKAWAVWTAGTCCSMGDTQTGFMNGLHL